MRIEKWHPTKHMGILQQWLRQRNAYLPSLEEMPEIGFVAVSDNEIPVAMAFLRRVEGMGGQIDGMTTDPIASAKDRHEGIEIVTDTLVSTAKSLYIKALMIFTTDDCILKRSQHRQFTKLPHSVAILDLTGH